MLRTTPTGRVRSRRARLMVAASMIALLLIGGLAYNVQQSQTRARAGLEHEFARRATLAGGLTRSALTSSAPAQLKEAFGGPSARLDAAMREFEAFDPDPRAAVLDARGQALARWPRDSAVGDLVALPVVRAALRGRFSISDLHVSEDGEEQLLTLATPFDTRFGRRVGVQVVRADVVATFASAYLANAAAARGGRGYLIDGAGRVLASSLPITQGRALPDGPLLQALRARRSGSVDERYFAAAPLTGTRWRVVLTAPRDALFASVQSTRRAAWVLFAALAAALSALVAVGLTALRTSSQLAASRERERASEVLAHERLHDGLTGLPNRTLFLDRVDQAMAIADRGRRAIAVLSVDVDRFARINESLGHASGDKLLLVIAQRLRATLAPGDVVGRYGGDEFLVLCAELDAVDDALHAAQRVLATFDESFELNGRSVHVSACVGIALHLPTVPADDGASLVRDANAAMHGAKTDGSGRLQVSDSELHGDALARLDTEAALRHAVDRGELRVAYQPIVALPDGAVRGVEALVRWQRPGVGLVPPLAFIPLAEETGLIVPLGRWVLQTAMAEVATWERDGLLAPDFVLSVNVSARQLSDENLSHVVRELLASWPLRPTQLWLEITETAVASQPELARRELATLAALGVHIAIDDFGVGQSSLDQLVHSLPVDILKLDRSFTSHLGDGREHAVAAAIVPMARALRMTAVAEGVETADEAAALAALGYPLAQGYHFGRPVDGRQTRALLATARDAGVVSAAAG